MLSSRIEIDSCAEAVRERGVTPHIAQTRDKRRASRVDGRTTRHPGYELSQRKRKLVEEIFGWMKTVGGVPENAVPREGAGRGCGRTSPPRRTTWSGCRSCFPRESIRGLPR